MTVTADMTTRTMTAVVQTEYGVDTRRGVARRHGADPAGRGGRGGGSGARRRRGPGHLAHHVRLAVSHPAGGVRHARVPRRSIRGAAWRVSWTPSGPGVTAFKPGDEVYGTGEGSFAEFARVRVDRLALKPVTMTFEQAATVPVSAVTALQAVRKHGRVEDGQKVLVIGASGGVGTFAVQLAKLRVRRSPASAAPPRSTSSGAWVRDHVLDYTRTDVVDGSVRYDVILDIGGNRRLTHLRRALAPRDDWSSSAAQTRADGWRDGSATPGSGAVALRRADPGHLRHEGERDRSRDPPRADRRRQPDRRRRSGLPARRDGHGDPAARRRRRARQDGHLDGCRARARLRTTPAAARRNPGRGAAWSASGPGPARRTQRDSEPVGDPFHAAFCSSAGGGGLRRSPPQRGWAG